MVRFLHTADWQLGMTRHFLGADAQPRYTEARLEAVRRAGRVALEHGCAFMVVCGDVFESHRLSRAVIARSLDAMGSLGLDVYLLPGNHDPLNEGSIWRTPQFAARPPSVHLLEEPVELLVDGGPVQLVPAPWRSKRPLTDLVDAALRDLSPFAGVRVVVAHGAVDALNPNREDPAAILLQPLEARIGRQEVQYVALGDRHSLTRVGGGDRIHYSGSPLVTDFVEDPPGRVLVVDAERDRVACTPVQVGDWRFVLQDFEFDDTADVDQLSGWLEQQPDKSRTVVKLSLVGTLGLAGKARLDDELERFGEVFAGIEVWQRHTDLAVLPDDADLARLGLAGSALAALDDLRAEAGRGDDAAGVAQDALALLYRLGATR